MTTRFDDETLMAFADGCLDAETTRRVQEAAERDADLAARIAAFSASRHAVKAVYAGLADLPVPPRLAESVRSMVERSNAGQPVASAPVSLRQRMRKPHGNVVRLALAACLAGAVAAPLGYLLGGGLNTFPAGEPPLAIGDILPRELAAALDKIPSGEETMAEAGGRFRPIASFVDAGGALCREFELDRSDTLVAVACRRGAGWRIAFAVEAPPVGEGYAPASSIAVLDAYLDAMSAGEPLSPEDEARALADLAAS